MIGQRLTLRPGRAADAAQVSAINAAGVPGVTRLAPDELDAIVGTAALYLVAAIDDRVVAYLLALAPESTHDGDEFRWFRSKYTGSFLYIDQVAVAEDCRGKGVGSRLYRELEARARESPAVSRLVCEVNLVPPNPGSARFHDRHGYVEVATLETGDGRVVSLRSRSLEGP